VPAPRPASEKNFSSRRDRRCCRQNPLGPRRCSAQKPHGGPPLSQLASADAQVVSARKAEAGPHRLKRLKRKTGKTPADNHQCPRLLGRARNARNRQRPAQVAAHQTPRPSAGPPPDPQNRPQSVFRRVSRRWLTRQASSPPGLTARTSSRPGAPNSPRHPAGSGSPLAQSDGPPRRSIRSSPRGRKVRAAWLRSRRGSRLPRPTMSGCGSMILAPRREHVDCPRPCWGDTDMNLDARAFHQAEGCDSR